MARKNQKNSSKTSKSVRPQTKKLTQQTKNQKVKSIIETLKNKTKKEKSKIDVKGLVDKALLFIMVAQLLFLVYYFLGY